MPFGIDLPCPFSLVTLLPRLSHLGGRDGCREESKGLIDVATVIYLSFFLWNIWGARNGKVFRHTDPEGMGIVLTFTE